MKSILLILCQIIIFGVYTVPNNLLEPYVKDQSMIFVNRLSFGLHIPFFKMAIIQWRTPNKNDIVVVTTKHNKNLLRRVIGLPREEFIFNGKRFIVPDDTIFVGLSEANSIQYPEQFGFVMMKNILGKCVFVLN